MDVLNFYDGNRNSRLWRIFQYAAQSYGIFESFLQGEPAINDNQGEAWHFRDREFG